MKNPLPHTSITYKNHKHFNSEIDSQVLDITSSFSGRSRGLTKKTKYIPKSRVCETSRKSVFILEVRDPLLTQIYSRHSKTSKAIQPFGHSNRV